MKAWPGLAQWDGEKRERERTKQSSLLPIYSKMMTESIHHIVILYHHHSSSNQMPSLSQQQAQALSIESSSATSFLRFNAKPGGVARQPGMRVFDRVLDFPCIFDIKVIGEPAADDDGSFDRDILELVGQVRRVMLSLVAEQPYSIFLLSPCTVN